MLYLIRGKRETEDRATTTTIKNYGRRRIE